MPPLNLRRLPCWSWTNVVAGQNCVHEIPLGCRVCIRLQMHLAVVTEGLSNGWCIRPKHWRGTLCLLVVWAWVSPQKLVTRQWTIPIWAWAWKKIRPCTGDTWQWNHSEEIELTRGSQGTVLMLFPLFPDLCSDICVCRILSPILIECLQASKQPSTILEINYNTTTHTSGSSKIKVLSEPIQRRRSSTPRLAWSKDKLSFRLPLIECCKRLPSPNPSRDLKAAALEPEVPDTEENKCPGFIRPLPYSGRDCGWWGGKRCPKPMCPREWPASIWVDCATWLPIVPTRMGEEIWGGKLTDPLRGLLPNVWKLPGGKEWCIGRNDPFSTMELTEPHMVGWPGRNNNIANSFSCWGPNIARKV
jgi:hypothetical protein